MRIFVAYTLACLIMLSFSNMPGTRIKAAGPGIQSSSESLPDPGDTVQTFHRSGTYTEYLQSHSRASQPEADIVINARDYSENDGAEVGIAEINGRENVLRWDNRDGALTWEVEVAEEGLYGINVAYSSLSGHERKLIFSLYINGERPFTQARRMVLPIMWKCAGPITQDSRGNDIRPSSVPDDRWVEEWVSDKEGFYQEHFLFYFNEGVNTITIAMRGGPLALDTITLSNLEALVPYSEHIKNTAIIAVPEGYRKQVEAELPLYRSDTVLYPTSDNTNPDTSPSHHTAIKLNTVGGWGNWEEQGHFLVWEVEVEQEGHYNLGLRVRQNFNRGILAYRRLYVNGEVPFAEVDTLSFSFAGGWQNIVLGDENGPFLFHLNKGVNEIRIEAVPGDSGAIRTDMADISFSLSNIFRRILMITGTDPDPYRDYQLEREIPGLMDTIAGLSEGLKESERRLTSVGGQGLTANASIIRTLYTQLDSFIRRPDTIPQRLEEYQWNISSFADFTNQLRDQQLEMDYFVVFSPDQTEFAVRSGFLNHIWFRIRAFFGSFTTDYAAVGNLADSEDAITVWIGLWRDQVQIVKDLTDNYFTPETGINVNIKLVQQGLIPAILSGRGPDAALYINDVEVVNLASRGGLVELSGFDGFNDAKGRFSPYAFAAYEFDGGIYGMPLTENFQVMFVRNDIFDELGISPPKTWEEFYRVMSVLQRNNMSVGVPIEDINIFASLLHQQGGRYFNDNFSRTELNSPEAVNAFRQWTDFYTMYGLPQDYSLYQRFRTGEMPLGIDSYVVFNMLTVAAPEINGLWGIYPIPGMYDEDGIFNNTAVASGMSAVILRDADNLENTWRFLEWFTSTEIQTLYGMELEALLGGWGRYDTANQETFERLPWEREQADVIRSQWENSIKLPQVPGGYYVNRGLINAFRAVVYHDRNPRETLMRYTRDIDNEMERKRIEFGLE